MSYVPLVIPATSSTSYADVRITNLSISQSIAGGVVYISATMKRCTKNPSDSTQTIDAPDNASGSHFSINFQLGIDTIYNDPTMSQLMSLIYRIGLTEAVKQGFLQVAP